MSGSKRNEPAVLQELTLDIKRTKSVGESDAKDDFKTAFDLWSSTFFQCHPTRWNRVILVHPSKVEEVRAACGTTRNYLSKANPETNQFDCIVPYKVEKGFGDNSFLIGCGATTRIMYLMLQEWLGDGNFFVAQEDQYVVGIKVTHE